MAVCLQVALVGVYRELYDKDLRESDVDWHMNPTPKIVADPCIKALHGPA